MKYRKKCTRLRPKALFISFVSFALLAAVSSCILYFQNKSGQTAMQVNGEPVAKEEFKLFEDGNLANTVNYFNLKYNAEYTEDFWNRSFDGEVPCELLRKNTIEQLVKVKIEQKLLKDYGIVTDITYTNFLENLKKENKRRNKALKSKQVIYGPVNYSEREYYDYLLTTNIIKLKEILVQKGIIKVSVSNLMDFYDKNSETLFPSTDTIKTSKLRITYVNKDGSINQEAKLAAYEAALKAKERIDAGEDFDKVAADTNQEKKALFQVFDHSSERIDTMTYNKVLKQIKDLKPGQITGVINDNGAFWILKVIERKGGDRKSFEEGEDYVRTKYVDEKYEELVNALIKKADVKYFY